MNNYIYLKIPISELNGDNGGDFRSVQAVCLTNKRIGLSETVSAIEVATVDKVPSDIAYNDGYYYFIEENTIPNYASDRGSLQLIIPSGFFVGETALPLILLCKKEWEIFVKKLNAPPKEADIREWVFGTLVKLLNDSDKKEERLDCPTKEHYWVIDQLVKGNNVSCCSYDRDYEEKWQFIRELKCMLPPKLSSTLTFSTIDIESGELLYNINFCKSKSIVNDIAPEEEYSDYVKWLRRFIGEYPTEDNWNKALGVNADDKDNFQNISDYTCLEAKSKSVLLVSKFLLSKSLLDFNSFNRSNLTSSQCKIVVEGFFNALKTGTLRDISVIAVNAVDIGQYNDINYNNCNGTSPNADETDGFLIGIPNNIIFVEYLLLLESVYNQLDGCLHHIKAGIKKFLDGAQECYNYNDAKVKHAFQEYFATIIVINNDDSKALASSNEKDDEIVKVWVEENQRWLTVFKNLLDGGNTEAFKLALTAKMTEILQRAVSDNDFSSLFIVDKGIKIYFNAEVNLDAEATSNEVFKLCLSDALNELLENQAFGIVDIENVKAIYNFAYKCKVLDKLNKKHFIETLIKQNDVVICRSKSSTTASTSTSAKAPEQKDNFAKLTATVCIISLLLFVMEFVAACVVDSVLPWNALLMTFPWLKNSSVTWGLILGITIPFYAFGGFLIGGFSSRKYSKGAEKAKVELKQSVCFGWAAVTLIIFMICVFLLFVLTYISLK